MRGQINDGTCTRDGVAYPSMQWSMYKLRLMKFPGEFSRRGIQVFRNGKKVGVIAKDSMPKGDTDE